MLGNMTIEQAGKIRDLRLRDRCSWRAIAQICHDLGWGNWSPPSNRTIGINLCMRAARMLNEDYNAPPWN